jgi:hypothetical protein
MKIKVFWKIVLPILNIVCVPLAAFYLLQLCLIDLDNHHVDALKKIYAVIQDKAAYRALLFIMLVFLTAARSSLIISQLIVTTLSDRRRKKARAARLLQIRTKKAI